MTNDDYYDLLGVEADAPVADIRAAYRERKAEVSGRDDDDAKADAAALNKAWNVLSDPYQRGRYDEKRAEAGDDDGDGADDVVVDVPATRTRTTRTPRANTNKGRGAHQPLQPTITLPAGEEFAPPKKRLVAMGIDVFVLVVLFLGSFLVANAIEKSQHPTEHHLVSVLPDQINDAKKATSAAKKKSSATVDCTKNPASDADKTYCDAKKAQDDLQTKYDDATKKLAPTRSLISGVFFLVALLILLIPSLFGGQTLGKRLQGIRLVRLDGSRVGAAEVFRRYGVLALAAFAAYTFLGPVGPLVIVFVATMWTRNPNRQGLQDRFARTLVVSGQAH